MTADKIGETYKMKRVIFSEWALEWVESKRMYIKESTYANYKLAIMNHLIPEFGNLYIDEITRKIIQETISDWSVNGRVVMQNNKGSDHNTQNVPAGCQY